jgi:hypothetical protein
VTSRATSQALLAVSSTDFTLYIRTLESATSTTHLYYIIEAYSYKRQIESYSLFASMSNQEHDKYTVTTVTDDDDNENINATPDTGSAEQDRLRTAAEKRRQKILQQANTRMSIVEGTYSSSAAPVTTNEEAEAAAEAKGESVEDATIVDSVTEIPVNSSTDAPLSDAATTTSGTTSSKLAAMRRRRFQKKAVPPSSTSADAATTLEDKTKATEVLTSSSEPTLTENVAVVEPVKLDNESVIGELASSVASENKIVTEAALDQNDMDEHAPTTKKYLGVAKMRRRMIKERQEQQQFTVDETHKSDKKSSAPAVSKSSTSAAAIHLPKKHRSMITTMPILMYAVTTFFLFLTGLNIGLQQAQVNYCYSNQVIAGDTADGYCYNTSNEPQWSLVVHSELAPRKMGGLQRLLSTMNIVLPLHGKVASEMIQKEKLQVENRLLEHQNDDAEDEFSTTEPTEKIISPGNIDPLFQVDLDALTAGDGLYFKLGRFAVRIHRLILTLLFYAPKSMIQSLASFIWSFVQTPPILFIMAILIRHGLGRVVLGAKLPNTVVDETQHKDILSTVKTFVTKFVLSSFPTITVFYDVWTYIRSDMYVMLCGLFVGIALSHHHQAGSPYGETATSKMSTILKTETPVDGILDEL